jgi:predicted small secreted protein
MFQPRLRAAIAILLVSASLAGCATGRAYVGAEAGPTKVR